MGIECLNNRIGISGCDAPTSPASAEGATPVVEALPILVVNDLPGVSLSNLNAIVEDEDETFLTMWNKVVKRTLKKFEVLVKSKLNECYKLTDKEVVACLICENAELFDVALWYLHGTELMIERTSTDTLSRYTTIDLDKAEELKTYFYGEFQACLDDAVQGINPSDSDCVTDPVESNEAIRWVMQTP